MLTTTSKLQKFIFQNPNPWIIDIFEIKKIYQTLVDCIIEHNHLYYIENKPIISDKEYDELFAYIKKIEEQFPQITSKASPTQWIFWQKSEWFKQANHKVKLISLENSYNSEDIKLRNNRLQKELKKNFETLPEYSFSIEPKFDWISVEIIYQNWIFEQAITRWDWQTWDDITENVKTLESIPKKLNWNLENTTMSVRWEIVMSKSVRKKLNEEKQKLWEQVFANTRNATAWSIKLLNSNEVRKRKLNCFVYEILYTEWEINIWETQEEAMQKLSKLWLPIFKWFTKSDNIDEVIELCSNKTKQKLAESDQDFDWLVIKINELKLRESIWETSHHPKRAIAYKFPAEQISTQIESVDFQIWRTWIITPVANLRPVKLSGVTISRVSLHNFDFIKTKDIHQKDFVRLQRSGEVIPYIIWVIKENRTKNFDPKSKDFKIEAPQICPICKQKTIQKDIHFYCKNPNCDWLIKWKMLHFVSKNCMNIEWLWESIIEILIKQGLIKNFADLYKISDTNIKLTISKIPGFGDRKLSEMIKQLELSKEKELRRKINSLWISWVWKKMAQQLVLALPDDTKDLDSLKKQITNIDFLNSINWIWEKTILWIVSYFQENIKTLEELEKLWLKFNKKVKQDINLELSNIHFSITWSFPVSRDKIIEQFENKWAVLDQTPNPKTNIILIWENSGSKKKKAEELWMKIYSWRDNIQNSFNFLKDIITETTKQNWPQMQSLF